MATTTTASSAALAKLTVSKPFWEKDLVLQLVCGLASPLQLTVETVAAGKVPNGADCQLSVCEETVVLRQRNAILRCLIGHGLAYALDQRPYYLAGGHGTTSRSCSSSSAAALGSMTSWMSLADSHRPKKGDRGKEIDRSLLDCLDSHLERNSFLVPSAQPTLADFDLAVVIMTRRGADDSYPANVQRWLCSVAAILLEYAAAAGVTEQFSPVADGLKAVTTPDTLPVFFYGSEDPATILKPKQRGQQGRQQKQEQPDQGPGKGKQQAKGQQGKQQQQQQPEKPEKQEGGKKKGNAKQQQQAEPTELNISALDIRVGKITKVWPHEEAEKLFCEEIDLGSEQRQVASGLRPFYKTEDLQGKTVLVLCNLKQRKLAGFPSHGMVLCASNADHTAVELVVPPEGSGLGERVAFGGAGGQADPEPENKVAKKKIFEKLAPDLKTDSAGQVVWKEEVARTSAGIVKAINGMPGAQVS